MLAWMAFVEAGPSMKPQDARGGLKDCLSVPSSFLGKAFLNRVSEQDHPIEWLLRIVPHKEFRRRNYAENVAQLVKNLNVGFGMHGSPDSCKEVYTYLLR